MATKPHPAAVARKCTGKLNKLLKRLKPASTVGCIHDFRVQFKKTRALYRMVKAASKGSKPRLPKSWQKFYRHTGRLRDVSLLVQLVDGKFGPGALSEYFQLQESALEITLQKELKKMKPIRFKGKDWHELDSVLIAAYFGSLLQPLDQSYHHAVTDKQLHQIRKNLKDLLYNMGWLKEMGIPIPAIAQKIELADIEDLLEQLGQYQNTVVQSMVLRHLPPIPALHAVPEMIQAFLHELAHRQSLMRMGIQRSLEHFFHLHTAGTLHE